MFLDLCSSKFLITLTKVHLTYRYCLKKVSISFQVHRKGLSLAGLDERRIISEKVEAKPSKTQTHLHHETQNEPIDFNAQISYERTEYIRDEENRGPSFRYGLPIPEKYDVRLRFAALEQ